MTIVHSSRSRSLMVNRWASASRSALISFPKRNRTISLHPIVTLLTLFSNSLTTQAWPRICDVARLPNAHESTCRVLKRYTEMVDKLVIQILARDARRRSVQAVKPSTKLSVLQSLITSHMTERCLAQATISTSRPIWNPAFLIRCVHKPEKSVSHLKNHHFLDFFLSYLSVCFSIQDHKYTWSGNIQASRWH